MLTFITRMIFSLAAAVLLALSGGYVLNTSTPYGMERDPDVFYAVFFGLAVVGFILVASSRRLWCGWKRVFFYLSLILISNPILLYVYGGNSVVFAASIIVGGVGIVSFFISSLIHCSKRDRYDR